MSRKTIILSRVLLILYIAALAFLCFGQIGHLPQLQKHILGLEEDKIVHFLMFLPFPLLAYPAIGKEPDGPWKAIGQILLLFLSGCLLAAATELIQSRIPYRSADPKDFTADSLALAISSLIVFILMLVRGTKASRYNP